MFQNQQSFQFEGGNGQTVTLGPIMTAEDVEKVLVEKMNFFLVPSINALISRVEELTEEIRCVREDLKIYTGTFGTSVSDQQSTLENKVETFGGNLKTFLEKLNVLHHTSNDSLGRSISGNEATSRDPYVTVKIGDHEYPYFMSVGVWRQIAGSSITRTIVRGVLESLHSVKQMREFTLSGKGSSKSSKENTGGVMMTLFENTRKPVPPETVAIAIGVVCKLKDSELRSMYKDEVNEKGCNPYLQQVNELKKRARNEIRNILQSYRTDFDDEGRRINRKRRATTLENVELNSDVNEFDFPDN